MNTKQLERVAQIVEAFQEKHRLTDIITNVEYFCFSNDRGYGMIMVTFEPCQNRNQWVIIDFETMKIRDFKIESKAVEF